MLALRLGIPSVTSLKGVGYPGAYNVTPAWRASVKTNWATRDLFLLGDSTSRGFGAGEDVTGWPNSARHSLSAVLADLIAARSYNVADDSFFGGGSAAPASNYPVTDDRFVFGSGWEASASPAETVGGPWIINTTTTDPIVVTPELSWDRAYVYYRRTTGEMTLQVDAGGLTTVDTAPGSNGLVQIAGMTPTLGSHTLTLARTSGTVQLAGIEFFDTSTDRKQVLNLSRSGWTASNATTSATQAAALPTLGKLFDQRSSSLLMLNFGINDENGGITTASFKTSMQILIDAAVAKSAPVLLVGHNATSATPGAGYIQAHRELADTNGIPYFNLAALYSWAQIVANGWNFDGSSHLNADGYAAMAAKLDGFLAWAVL